MSTVHCNTVQTSSGGAVTLTKQSAAKGYAYWNQETPAIVDSLNASSITDTATGKGAINWSSAMSSASYMCTTGSPSVSSTGLYSFNTLDDGIYGYATKSTTSWPFKNLYTGAAAAFNDSRGSICAAMGDLA